MSRHNYSQYSKADNKSNNRANTQTVPVEEPVEIIDIVENTEAYDVINIVEKPTGIKAVSNTVPGTVSDCVRLNVRVAPFANAEVACVLNVESQLEINLDESVEDWYKVCTAAGIEGYCMKKFISARL